MRRGFTIFICVCFISALEAQTTFVPNGSDWSYFDEGMQPADQGSLVWTDMNYDHTAWANGSAQLGYGDGDEATTIANNIRTAYFRKSFNVIDTARYVGLLLNITYDDGAVIYVNGAEIGRVNMPGGTINYNTFASGNSSDNAQATISIPTIPLTGNNTIAVEIHQRSSGSTDLSFDCEVAGEREQYFINLGDNWSYYDEEQTPNNQGANEWYENDYDHAAWQNGNAHLGYGDADEVTIINNQTLVGYFTKRFDVSNSSIFQSLELNLVYDDGAIVYVNGEEVWRVNMPAGPIGYGDFAASSDGDNAQLTESIGNSLVNGSNLVAVEVHQISNTSSDLSFDFNLVARAPGPPDIIRGPYLQKSASDRVTIKWRTNLPAFSKVEYGMDINNLDNAVRDTNLKIDHEIEITGLTSKSVYYYQIGDTTYTIVPKSSELYFKTAPDLASTDLYRFWILGDPGTANNNQRAVRDAYYNYAGTDHTDGILFLGDNAYNSGTDQQYQNAMFKNMYEEKLKNSIAWSCLGNHDGFTADSETQTGPYYNIFSFPTNAECGGIASLTEAYYSFDYGNIHFIILDSYDTDRSTGGPMYNWAELDIQNTSQDWIVAMWHHPPYTKGSHNSDTETNLIEMRQRFLPMLESNGVDLVLSGHSHSYERSYFLNGHYDNSDDFDLRQNTVGDNGYLSGRTNEAGAYRKGGGAGAGAVYITTGSAGKITNAVLDHEAMFYSVADLGSCVLEVDSNRLDVKFVRETGAIDDYFTILKEDCDVTSFLSAIDCAQSGDTILVTPALFTDSILLNNRTAYIEKDLFIIADTSDHIVISAESVDHAFEIEEGSTVCIEGVTIISGTESEGRGILNSGNLILKDVTVLEHVPAINSGSQVKNNPDAELIIRGNVKIKN